MPPYSRGSVKHKDKKANGVQRRTERTIDVKRGLSGSEGKRSMYRDPLTTIVTLVAYPILLIALLLLHVLYHASFKARSSLRYVTGHLRATQTEDGMMTSFSSLCRLSSMIERRAERRLRLLTEANSMIDNHDHAVIALKATGRTEKIVRMPRHVGLAIGVKPMRWRTLLLRSILRTPKIKRECRHGIAEQNAFILANLKTIVRCAEMTRIEQLTVFDTEGYLRECYTSGDLDHWIEQEFASTTKIRVQVPFYEAAIQDTSQSASRRHSPSQFCITLHVLGPDDAKQAIANAANALLSTRRTGSVDVGTIEDVLSHSSYPGEPDLLILHGGARQVSTLHGFPPWLVRLAEIYHDFDATSYEPLTVHTFEKAVGRYMRAEQRYGK